MELLKTAAPLLKPLAPLAISEAQRYLSARTTTPASTLASLTSQNDNHALAKFLSKNPDVNRSLAIVTAASAGYLSSLDILLEPPPHVKSLHRRRRENRNKRKRSRSNSDEETESRQESESSDSDSEPQIDLDICISNTTPLLAALQNHHLKTALLLLSSGASPDFSPKSSPTPLVIASRTGDVDAVKLLLAHGAKVNRKDEKGDTPLIIAARWGREGVCKALLEGGARGDEGNSRGKTALGEGARGDFGGVVGVLCAWRGLPRAKDRDGEKGSERSERIDVNKRDKKGRTALHRAVEGSWLIDGVGSERKEDVVRMLLDAGANPGIRDCEGKMAIERVGWLGGSERLRRLLGGGGGGEKRERGGSGRGRGGERPKHGRSKTY